MTAMLWLIPLAFLFVAIAVWVFMWAVKRGQFDDLDSPGLTVLMDDDLPRAGTNTNTSANTSTKTGAHTGAESAPASGNHPAPETDRRHDRI